MNGVAELGHAGMALRTILRRLLRSTRADGDLLTEEPNGAEFGELVEELHDRYPAAPREAIEGALRASWKIGTSGWQCVRAAGEKLPEEYQWPAHLPK